MLQPCLTGRREVTEKRTLWPFLLVITVTLCENEVLLVGNQDWENRSLIKNIKKVLDSLKEFNYIRPMYITNLLTAKRVLKAAWHVTAVAEGGFY